MLRSGRHTFGEAEQDVGVQAMATRMVQHAERHTVALEALAGGDDIGAGHVLIAVAHDKRQLQLTQHGRSRGIVQIGRWEPAP